MQSLPANTYFQPECYVVVERKGNKSSEVPIPENLSDMFIVTTSGTQSSGASGSIVRSYELNVASWERIANPQFNLEAYYVLDDQKVTLVLNTNKGTSIPKIES